jgi:thiamine pyrophosphokinase
MKVIIISGGYPPTKEILRRELEESSFLICADSGGNCLYQYNIIPNYLIGDFDSIDRNALEFFSQKDCLIERYPVEKNYTDTELAVIKAEQLGAKKIVFLGCTGTRLDHTLGNIGLLHKCLNNNIEAYIKDSNNSITMVNHSLTLKGKPGDKFSLFAYKNPIENLTILGAKYNLNRYNLKIGDGLTISNEFMQSEVIINFDSGNLIIVQSKD